MTDPKRIVEVTQADRDAAAEFLERNHTNVVEQVWNIRRGCRDGDRTVQAFAHHRLDSIAADRKTLLDQAREIGERLLALADYLDPVVVGDADALDAAPALLREAAAQQADNARLTRERDEALDAGVRLALEAGKLNVALDGQEKYRLQRSAVIKAMQRFATIRSMKDTGDGR